MREHEENVDVTCGERIPEVRLVPQERTRAPGNHRGKKRAASSISLNGGRQRKRRRRKMEEERVEGRKEGVLEGG